MQASERAVDQTLSTCTCDAMQASERAVARDIADTHACALPYFSEHNAACGAFAAIQAGDHGAAVRFAETLRGAGRLFPSETVSPGEDVATLIEVHLQFGRCARAP